MWQTGERAETLNYLRERESFPPLAECRRFSDGCKPIAQLGPGHWGRLNCLSRAVTGAYLSPNDPSEQPEAPERDQEVATPDRDRGKLARLGL